MQVAQNTKPKFNLVPTTYVAEATFADKQEASAQFEAAKVWCEENQQAKPKLTTRKTMDSYEETDAETGETHTVVNADSVREVHVLALTIKYGAINAFKDKFFGDTAAHKGGRKNDSTEADWKRAYDFFQAGKTGDEVATLIERSTNTARAWNSKYADLLAKRQAASQQAA